MRGQGPIRPIITQHTCPHYTLSTIPKIKQLTPATDINTVTVQTVTYRTLNGCTLSITKPIPIPTAGTSGRHELTTAETVRGAGVACQHCRIEIKVIHTGGTGTG
jgi:hypothetical protein